MENNKINYKKETIKLTIPVFIELLVSSLFGMVDMMMVGNSGKASITTPSIAAVGITNQMILIGIGLAAALSTGGTAMISRYFGAKEPEKIPTVVKHMMFLMIIVVIIPLLTFNLVFAESIMKFIGAKPEVIDIGINYFRIVLIGFGFQAFNLSIFAAIRGAGDTKTPMKINMYLNMLNVFGNYILIFGKFGLPKMGVTGAGLSTSLSHILGTIVLMFLLLSKKGSIKIDFKERFELNKSIIGNIVKVGGPAAIEQVGFRFGVVLFIKIISGLGTTVYATHQIASNIISLSFSPGQSFGIAASTLAGKSIGEKSLDKAEGYIMESNRLAIIASTFFGIIFFFFGPTLVGLYTDDQAVIESSANVMRIMAFIQPFQGSAFAFSGGLRGAGDTVSTLIVTMIGVIFVRLITAYILINIVGMGLEGAWLAMLFDQIVRWIGIVLRYRTGKWKEIELA